MRRVLTLALVALAGLGMAVDAAWAQPAAPVPQVTITGFIDTISTWSKNLADNRFDRSGDKEWYSRNRGRFDIVGQLGTAKAVFGFEIDSTWGTASVGGQDTSVALGTNTGGVQHGGATSAFDINTDTQGSIETKWLYTEFQLPMMPFQTIVRVGAQPFATQYKLAAYANGDFAGVNVDMNFTPNVKGHFTYVAAEDNLTGSRRNVGFGRGDDWAIIASVEVTPVKGLDIRPLYSFFQAVGSTSGSARNSVGGVTFNRSAIGGVPGLGLYENRHTIGVDARWRFGAFSLDPTFFYQFGDRDSDCLTGPAVNSNTCNAKISAWFFDVIGGWRLGPLLLEARGVYTSGNKANDDLRNDTVNYYQPLDTDTSYWGAGWGEIYSLGIDYFQGAIRNMGVGIGLDRYGRAQFALRAIYSVTPAFDLRAVVSPAWTAKSVDTDALITFGNGGAAGNNINGPNAKGDSSYMGTEVDLGLTWRFAPGLTFDMVGAVLFAGHALDASELQNGVLVKRDAQNVYTFTSRIRYSF